MRGNAKLWAIAVVSCATAGCGALSRSGSMAPPWASPAAVPLASSSASSAPAEPRLPPPPAELAQALSANALMLKAIAVMEASGAPPARVEQSTQQVSAMIMNQLDHRLATDEILPYVRQAVRDSGRTPEAQQARAMNARMQPVRQAFQASPAVTAELERERASIEQAARFKNDAKTEARGEALHREIAARVAQRAGVPEPMAMIHVYTAINKQQMQLAFGSRGPLGAAIDERAAHAAKPMADVLGGLGKAGSVDFDAMGPAFQKAYAGDPTDAERLYRAEFVRSETLHRLRLRQSVERSEMDRQLDRGSNIMLDAVLTMVERNPTHAGIARLGYEELVAYRAKSPEAERRVAAALAATSDQPTRDASEKWRKARERIATLALRRAQSVALSAKEADELERTTAEEGAIAGRLAELSAAERGGDKPFDAVEGVSTLQGQLGANEAVLSYVTYGHVAPDQMTAVKRWRPSYGAFVLTKGGLAFRSLGAAAVVDQAIESFLAVLGDPGAALESKRTAAKALGRTAFAPVAPLLEGVTLVRVVADGLLQSVPLAALRDEGGWLAERLDVRYAFSERQLLGEHVPAVKAGAPVVLVPGPYSDSPKPLTRGQALTQKSFPNLPGSLAEARRVLALLPQARLLTGAQASEGALFTTRSPSVVHIAGHGVFLPPASEAAAKSRGVVLASSGANPTPTLPIDPMIGSALVLAPDASRGNDGFLTAFEVATAPLFGTELVVLSACESGRGNPDRIRGVRGLRQAFFTAGAKSLVLSLWSVSDQSTAELMAAFYEKLKVGQDRAEALRQASAALRAKNDDPFLWAPFVLIGRDGAIDFSPAAARSAPQGEDETTRLRRAMAFKRLQRTIDRLGAAKWSSRSGQDEALDANVNASQAGGQRTLVLTLLGKRESISLSVPNYVGPGRYAVEGSRLRAGRSAVTDPLKVNIVKLSPEGSEQRAAQGMLDVAQDVRATGLIGTFELRFKNGDVSRGSFQLESTEPPTLRPRTP